MRVEKNFLTVTFEIRACVNFPTQAIPGAWIHREINAIQIAQTEIGEWGGTYSVVADLPQTSDLEHAANIGEEVRSRLVALFAVASRVDASASDELIIESSNSMVAVSRRGDHRNLQKLATPMTITSLDSRIATCSELEWNALKRLRQAILSGSFADKFEAFASTIDILGNNDFPMFNRKVRKRMFAYLEQKLKVSHEVAERIIEARHSKIHENALDQNLKSDFYALIHQVVDDICMRFYLPIKVNAITRMLTDDMGLVYSVKDLPKTSRKESRNGRCSCNSGKKFKKCCGAKHFV